MDVTGLSKLGGHVAESEDRLLAGASPNERVRRAVAERAAAHRERTSLRGPRHFKVALAALVCCVATLAVALVLVHRRTLADETLSFTIGEPPRAGVLHEWIASARTAPVPLRFSDGSKVLLEPDSRGRVTRLRPLGADLVVESGRIQVAIVPRKGTDFRVRVGPFDVEVKGTRFTASWNVATEQFELDLEAGRVLVRGCGLDEGVIVVAGRRLEASCNPPKVSLHPRGEPKPEEHPAADHGGTPQPVAPASATSAALSRPEPTVVVAWPSLARDGHFQNAYEAAVRSGFDAECARAANDELLLLGDAARLSGHVDQARRAYLVLRERFPSSPAAAQAAFHLGRLAGNGADGDHWFQAYLSEQPRGPLAEAALGRLLESSVNRGDARGARALAQTYLERYPAGAHVDTAQQILREYNPR